MKQYRVTKYDPAYRDAEGRYIHQEEWTHAGQIGEDCGGKVLTLDEYVATETSYVSAVVRFFESSNLPHLRVTNFCRSESEADLTEFAEQFPLLDHPAYDELSFTEDQIVKSEEIALLAKHCMRGTVDCRLEFDGHFFAHFDWDYYLYIGCSENCREAIEYTESLGLFVEECLSPIGRPKDQDLPMVIQVSEPSSDPFAVIDEITVPSLDWRKARAIFGFSDEHPFFGYYDMSSDVAKRFASEFSLTLDVEKRVFSLDTTGPDF